MPCWEYVDHRQLPWRLVGLACFPSFVNAVHGCFGEGVRRLTSEKSHRAEALGSHQGHHCARSAQSSLTAVVDSTGSSTAWLRRVLDLGTG